MRTDPHSVFSLLKQAGDEFDDADFAVTPGEHPDEVSLDPSMVSKQPIRKDSLLNQGQSVPSTKGSFLRNPSSPSKARHTSIAPTIGPQTPTTAQAPSRVESSANLTAQNDPGRQRPLDPPPRQQSNSISTRPQATLPNAAQLEPSIPSLRLGTVQHPQNQGNELDSLRCQDSKLSYDLANHTDSEPPIGFFTARVAESLQTAGAGHPNAQPFNPHLESPSIRKTAGVDHSKTKPIIKEAVGAPLAVPSAAAPTKTNFINPQTDQARRIGLPGGAASPLQNRSSYKPPQMKRPAEGNPSTYSLQTGNLGVTADKNIGALDLHSAMLLPFL